MTNEAPDSADCEVPDLTADAGSIITDFHSNEISPVSEKRESTRRELAVYLLALIAAITLALVLGAIFKFIPSSEAKDLATIILPPLTSILASMIGFFFGEATRKS